MGNLTMVFPNRTSQPTVSGGGWSTGLLSLQALRTRQVRHVARTLNADPRHSFFYLDAGAAIACGMAVLAGHNLETAHTWRLRGYAADPRAQFEASFCWPGLPAGFTFSRGSAGRYFGADGLNSSAGNNTLRVTHDPSTLRARGALIELGATNYLQYCRAPTGWTVTGGSLTQVATGIDGVTNSALLLTASAAPCTMKRTPSAAPAGGAVLSVWVFGVVVTGAVSLSIDDFATSTNVTVTVGQWVRVSIHGTYGAAAVGIRLANSGDSVRLDFFQHEQALANAPSSEILTTAASAARSADVLSIANVTALGITPSSATMVARLRVTRIPTSEDNVLGLAFSSTDFIGLSITAAAVAHARVFRASANEAHIAGPTLAVGDYITVAMTWANNNVRVSFNGGAVATDTSATMPTVTAFQAICTNGSAFELERLAFWNGQLPDADLVYLSGQGENVSRPPDHDSGSVAAWPAAYVSGTTAEQRAGMRGNAIYRPGTPQTYRYWRIDLAGEGHAATYLQLGRVLMGDAWEVAENPAYGELSLGIESRDLVGESDGGSEYFTPRLSPRVARYPLRLMQESEALGQALEMQRQLGTSGELFWLWDPADTRWLPLRSFLGRMRTLSPLEASIYGRYATAFEVKELL